MCYGVLGNLFSFGSCQKEFPRSKYSLSVSSIKSQVKNSIARTNQQSRNEIGGSQLQNVTINGYTSGAPDIIITQRMNIKLASSSQLTSTISDQMLVNASNAINSQIENLMNTNPALSLPKNKIVVQNIQANITQLLRSESAKYAIQEKMSSSITIQNQEILINFSQGVSPKIVDSPERTYIKFYDGRPVIEIDQSLINDLIIETTMESIISEIVNNSELQVLAHKLMKNLESPSTKLVQSVFSSENPEQKNELKNNEKNKEEKNNSKKIQYFFSFIRINNNRNVLLW
jgi:hypothetical protein